MFRLINRCFGAEDAAGAFLHISFTGTIFASVTRVLDLQVEENLFDQLECRNSVTTNCFILTVVYGNMVRGYKQEHTYRHPWERVSIANFRKFADLEHRSLLSHVADVRIVNRTVDPKIGQIFTTRSITINAPGPWWLQRLMGTNVCLCLEESIIDNDKRSLEIVTRNVTLKDFVDVEEKCSYNPHPENEDWTLLRQETSITCQTSMPALKSMAEKIEQKCVEKFQHNSARGREVVEAVCKALERAESGAVTKAEPHLVVNPQQNSKTRSHGIKWRIFEAASLMGATL